MKKETANKVTTKKETVKKETVKKVTAKKTVMAKTTKKAAPKASKEENPVCLGIKKSYLKSGDFCTVTFHLPAEACAEAQTVTIVGEFNNWSPDASVMKKMKDGSRTISLKLEAGRDYRFRYLIDNDRWENDWFADRYEPNSFFGDDSIVTI